MCVVAVVINCYKKTFSMVKNEFTILCTTKLFENNLRSAQLLFLNVIIKQLFFFIIVLHILLIVRLSF